MKKIVLIIGAILVGVFILIQFVPYGHDHYNPPVINTPNWDNAQTADLAQHACYECHSNQTEWPWYSYIAPTSWLVEYDVQHARVNLNFSEWSTYQLMAGDAVAMVQAGKMPPWRYWILHPDAHLTDAQRQQLIQGLQALESQSQ